jgi:hypothetical protein
MRTFGLLFVLTFAVTACSPGSGPTGAPPSLEMRTFSDKTTKIGTANVRKHVVGHGYWISECTARRELNAASAWGWCDVYFSDKGPLRRGMSMLPFMDRATVQYYKNDAVKIALFTRTRKLDTPLTYECGAAVSSGSEKDSQVKFLYTNQAASFASQMEVVDCTLTYTPQDADKEVVTTFPFHGAREAFAYAKNYASQPSGL